MWSILTDANNDIYLNSKKSIAIGEDKQALSQIIKNSILTLLGEIELDTTKGIPYFDSLFLGIPDLDLFESYLRNTIKNIDGVIAITNYIYEIKDNIFRYKIYIQTIYGDIEING
ncbi:MAG: hypothetical protein LBF97_01180 [Elusimicrobiota bacterium]|jgi:hypothetical protein|nr:hypothetical protein [Elusimicrobiota bacterium]